MKNTSFLLSILFLISCNNSKTGTVTINLPAEWRIVSTKANAESFSEWDAESTNSVKAKIYFSKSTSANEDVQEMQKSILDVYKDALSKRPLNCREWSKGKLTLRRFYLKSSAISDNPTVVTVVTSKDMFLQINLSTKSTDKEGHFRTSDRFSENITDLNYQLL